MSEQYIFRLIGEGRGKGVGVFIKKSWYKMLLPGSPNFNDLGFAWSIKLSFGPLDVINVYRSPSARTAQQNQTFVDMINSLLGPSNTKPTLICGDFNYDYWKLPNNPVRVMLDRRGFTQIVTVPTTINGNCIDHAYVRNLCHDHKIITRITPIMKLYV